MISKQAPFALSELRERSPPAILWAPRGQSAASPWPNIWRCGFSIRECFVHKSKFMQIFYYRDKFNVLKLSARNPDLDPSENFWSSVEDFVTKRRPGTPQELKIHLFDAWKNKITPNFRKKLYDFYGLSCVSNVSKRSGKNPLLSLC